MASLRVCGPKFSICCSVLSVWGIIMLVIMGILLKVNSVAFAEDLKIEELIKEPPVDKNKFLAGVDRLYAQGANNCFIAACLYIVSLSLSVWQYYHGRRAVSS